MDGIGSSFTEASAFVLAHLDKDKRIEVMEKDIWRRRCKLFAYQNSYWVV